MADAERGDGAMAMTGEAHTASSLWVTLSSGRQPALMAPANGFPPQVYEPLAQALAPDLGLWGWIPRPMRATEPPPEDLHWSHLAREYADHLGDVVSLPVIGLGHSLGGVMTLMAAVLRPQAFRAVVLLDPVIFEPRVLCHVQRWRRRGAPLEGNFPLARLVRGALHRRQTFSSPPEAEAHFRSRALFRKWHPRALEAYVSHGLRSQPQGWRLAYDPRWEAAIFRAVPTDVWKWVRRVRVPGLVLFGQHSEMGTPATRTHLARWWPQATIEVLPDQGHMFPMEVPQQAAERIRAWLKTHRYI